MVSPDNPKGMNSAYMVEFERNFLSGMLETTNALIVVLDTDGRILRINRAIERLTAFTIIEAIAKLFWEFFLVADEWTIFKDRFADASSSGSPFEVQCRLRAKGGLEYHVLWSCSAIRNDDGNAEFIIVTGINITALKQAEREKEKLILDLQTALANVKTLSGLLPICAGCHKIRDDRGYWQQVEKYIQSHSNVDFTHSICPDCSKRLYPEFTKNRK
jgi:PAS domain S-box-containing protein